MKLHITPSKEKKIKLKGVFQKSTKWKGTFPKFDQQKCIRIAVDSFFKVATGSLFDRFFNRAYFNLIDWYLEGSMDWFYMEDIFY